MDYKATIIEELSVMMQHAQKERATFKVRAYNKVISQLRAMPVGAAVRTMEDLEVAGIEGIGEGIRKKIVEILATGTLAAAEEIKNDSEESFSTTLMNIYGVGPAKAKAIIKAHPTMRTIEDLRALCRAKPKSKLLNEKQKIGLQYYEDLLLRIPRDEMRQHEQIIIDSFRQVSPKFVVSIVGSYRRGAENSGDIDALVTLPVAAAAKGKGEKLFQEAVQAMTESGYITDTLALGDKKFMGICRVGAGDGGVARRLDLLITTKAEYPYALLYFTGSDKFNIAFRKQVMDQGYSLSEHGVKVVREEGVPAVPAIKTEKGIFKFFKIPYVVPSSR